MVTVCLAAMMLAGSAAPPRVIPWSELRESIARTICVVDAPDTPHGRWASFGRRSACGLPGASTPQERAIDRAFELALPLLVAIPPVFTPEPKGIERAYAAKEHEEQDRLAREVYLASEEFLRALVPRLRSALQAEGMACDGCPEFPSKPMERLSWDDFSRYVTVFVRPDPVRTPLGKDGKPTGKPSYPSFHVCSGLAEVPEARGLDAVLLRAAFVVTFPTSVVRERTGHHLEEMLSEPAFLMLGTDEGRTRFLLDHLAERLRADPEVRAGICEAFRQYSSDIGLALTDCPPPANEAPKPARP